MDNLVGVPDKVHKEITAIQRSFAEQEMRNMNILGPTEKLSNQVGVYEKFYAKVDLKKYAELEAKINEVYKTYFLQPGEGQAAVKKINDSLKNTRLWSIGKGARLKQFGAFAEKFLAITAIFVFLGQNARVAKALANPSVEQEAAFQEFLNHYEAALAQEMDGRPLGHDGKMALRDKFIAYPRAINFDPKLVDIIETLMGATFGATN